MLLLWAPRPHSNKILRYKNSKEIKQQFRTTSLLHTHTQQGLLIKASAQQTKVSQLTYWFHMNLDIKSFTL